MHNRHTTSDNSKNPFDAILKEMAINLMAKTSVKEITQIINHMMDWTYELHIVEKRASKHASYFFISSFAEHVLGAWNEGHNRPKQIKELMKGLNAWSDYAMDENLNEIMNELMRAYNHSNDDGIPGLEYANRVGNVFACLFSLTASLSRIHETYQAKSREQQETLRKNPNNWETVSASHFTICLN